MKTPTIEEVREKFKDADMIGSKLSGLSVKNNGKFRKGYFDNDYYLDSGAGIEVWSQKNGYAKILTYKTPQFQAIAMKCTQEQFDAIKPKLEKAGIEIENLHSFDRCKYLVNNLGGYKTISNVLPMDKNHRNRTVHETWNEEIFLKACGIKIEETMKITKKEIIALDKGNTTVRELFPEVFKIELEVGSWYKWEGIENNKPFAVLMCITKITKNSISRYGFVNGRFNSDYKIYTGEAYKEACENLKPATPEEVKEALTKEAVKKGVKEGVWIDHTFYPENNGIYKPSFAGFTSFENNIFIYKGVKVFDNGIWATIIETITKEEAEKLLNKKIV